MKHEWHQTDYLLEDCPIHGFKITEIPMRTNYGIKRNIYSNIGQPKIFPYERNIIHSTSNYSLRNQNNDYLYNINDYSNQIPQKEINNQNQFINNYRLNASGSGGDFADNYSFYISGSSRLRPKVTISKKRAECNCQTPNTYYNNYNYNDNIGRERTILNNYNNSNSYLRPNFKRYDICITDANEVFNTNNNSRRRNYLTPNYYNNDSDEEGIDLNVKKYHLNRNMNNQNIIEDNIYERRIITESDELPLKRRIINGYNNNKNYNYKKENIPHVNIPMNERNIRNEQAINVRKNYKNNAKLIPDRIKKYYANKYNSTKETNNKVLYINQNINNNIRSNEEQNNKIKVKMTNLNNHKFYLSNDNKEFIQYKNNRTIIQQKPIRINKYYLDKINKNIKENKDIFNKSNLIKDKNPFINGEKIFNINRKNDYSSQIIKDKLNNKNKIKIKRKQMEQHYNTENLIKIPKEKNEKIEQHIEKYYDSQGNCIGGKKVIIKKRYKANGEKVVKEVIKESYKPNFKEIFKKYIPKKEDEGNEEGKIEKERNDNYFQLQKENIQNSINNNIEGKNEEMRIPTFGIKSQSIRFEEEAKDEKEADEQQILVNSEFGEDTPRDIKEDRKDENKIIINDEDKKDINININSIIDGNNIHESIKIDVEKKENIEENLEEIKKDSNKGEIKEDIQLQEIKNDSNEIEEKINKDNINENINVE